MSNSAPLEDDDGYQVPTEEFMIKPPRFDKSNRNPMETEWNEECKTDPTCYKFDFPQNEALRQQRVHQEPIRSRNKPGGIMYSLASVLGFTERPVVVTQSLTVVRHVRNMRERRQFLVNLAHALLYFAAPSHQILKQLDMVAGALGVEVEIVHVPTLIMMTLSDGNIAPKQTRFIRANGRIALSSLEQVHAIVREVSHDQVSCDTGSELLDEILSAKPIYNTYERCILSFLCASIICGTAFGGSPIELGFGGLCSAFLTFASLRGRNTVLDNVYEITMAMFVSFIARALSSIPGNVFCYSAISSSGIVSILPGFMILTSALELFSKNMLCGSARLVYALIYSFILAFSLTIGSDFYFLFDATARHLYSHVAPPPMEYVHVGLTALNGTWANTTIGGTMSMINTTNTDAMHHIIKGCFRAPEWPWWRQPLPWWTIFFLVPMYLACSSLQNLHNFRKTRDFTIMVLFACASYAVNTAATKYIERVTFSTTAGAIVIGLLGNTYSRVFGGSAFTSMVTGVVFLVPSGIANAGGLSQTYVDDVAQYQTGFNLAVHMLQVAIGVTLGLSFSQMLVYTLGSKKKGSHFAF